MSKAVKKHEVKTDEEKKQDVIDFILDYFETTDEIDHTRYCVFTDKDGLGDIVVLHFITRRTMHLWNKDGFTPYEEIKDEKLVKMFVVDVAPKIEWNKSLTSDQQEFVDRRRVCNDLGIVYIVHNDSDEIIDAILKVK